MISEIICMSLFGFGCKMCFEYYRLLQTSSTCNANHKCHCSHFERSGEHTAEDIFCYHERMAVYRQCKRACLKAIIAGD
jgi:hypothetical protein